MELTKDYLTEFIYPLRVGQTCEPPPPPPPPPADSLEAQVERLRREFIAYVMTGTEPDSDPGRIVVEMVGDVQSKHEKDLDLCHRSLALDLGRDLRPENVEVMAQTIATKCLESPGRCNWGRVAAVLAFARLVVRRMEEEEEEETSGGRLIESYSVSTGSFLARFILEWRGDVGEGDLGLVRLDSPRSSLQWLSGCFATVVKVGAMAANYANDAIR